MFTYRCTLVILVCSPVSRSWHSSGQKPGDKTVGHQSAQKGSARSGCGRAVASVQRDQATEAYSVGWRFWLSLLIASAV